jgi:hypothetical protein
MLIDCTTCALRNVACHDCVVTVILGPVTNLTSSEQLALAALAEGGLVPPLRLVPARSA